MSQIYEKWRDLEIDPFTIKYKNIELIEILSYPPAGNDVIECKCKINNTITNAFIKIERSKMADFDSENKNLNIINKNKYLNNVPLVYESGIINDKRFIVLEKMHGDRLSDIFKKKISKKEKNDYLFNYGKQLAIIHNIPVKEFGIAKQRIINDYPKEDKYKEFDLNIKPYIDYLINNKPTMNNNTFIHGDFHYANILWNERQISGIIDFEYSGKGYKEQDIAWSLILRSTQHFMNKIFEIKMFIKGYMSSNSFDYNAFKWCLINGYCHFYLMNRNNEKYKVKILELIKLVSQDALL